jgi:MFS family permease
MSTATATPPAAPALWTPLRVASYRWLFLGQTSSLLGDQLLVVALPFLILGGGGGPVELGTVLTAYGAARVCALPFGGWLGDHVPRRLVMMCTDLVRAALVLALIAIVGTSRLDLTALVFTVVLIGLSEGLFLPVSYAILPGTVPPELLSRANALSSSAQNLALLVGPGLGGLIAAAVSPRLNLAIDAATFLISAGTLMFVRERAGEPDTAVPGEAAGFFGFLRTSRLMQIVLALTIISNLAYFGMLELALPVWSSDVLRTGAFGFGLALAGFGLGSFAGGLLITRLERLPRRGLVACALGVAQGACFAAIAVVGARSAAGLVATVTLMALAGLTAGVLNVFYLSRTQEAVPSRLMGRAMSALMLAVFAIHPVSVAAAAVLTRASGPGPVFALAGLSIVLSFAAGARTRTYRNL